MQHDEHRGPESAPPRNDDTDAILTRRGFLVAAALAGVGMGASACNRCSDAGQPCLSIAIQPQPDAGTTGADTQAGMQVCLKVAPPGSTAGDEEPQVCLKVAPPKDPPSKEDEPGICLSVEPYPPAPPAEDSYDESPPGVTSRGTKGGPRHA